MLRDVGGRYRYLSATGSQLRRMRTYQSEAQPCNAPRALRTIRATRPRQVTDPERRWLSPTRRLRQGTRRLTRSSRSLSATRRERRMPPGGLTDDGSADAWRNIATRRAQGQRWKSGHPKERERTHSAASHAEGRHARWGGVVVPRVTTELVKAWSINRH